jgi:hypothetical protein
VVNAQQLLEGNFSNLNELNDSFVALLLYERRLKQLRSTRYVTPREHHSYSVWVYELDLRKVYGEVPWLTDREFLLKYRTTREGLEKLVDSLKDAPSFTRGAHGPEQMPVKYQVMIWLHFFGHEGMTVDLQRTDLHTCTGLCEQSRERVTAAFNHIHHDWIQWPDEEERKAIANRIEQEFFLSNAVGIMDDTLLKLGMEPCCSDKADYHGRKYAYSITCNVISDDKCCIRDYLAGFPGSTHDSHVWRNMNVYNNPKDYFASFEYLITNTAYEPTWFCIPAYKCTRGNHLLLPAHKTEFNFCIARPRVKSEHVNGIWKGQCPWLRSISMKLTDNKETTKHILRSIDAKVVFHNIMMEFLSNELPDDYNDNVTVITDIDDADSAPLPEERIILDQPLYEDDPSGTRLDQLLHLVEEFYIRPVYGSPISVDTNAMEGIDHDSVSELGGELEFYEEIECSD